VSGVTNHQDRLFERVQDRFCASVNAWCSKNSHVSFLAYDYQSMRATDGRSRQEALRSRWPDIVHSVNTQGRAVALFDEDTRIQNEDMNYDYQGKSILVAGLMDGLFVPVNVLYKTAFLNPNRSAVHPIELGDFLSGHESVFPSFESRKRPSFVILDNGKPVIGFACPSLCICMSISADETIEFSTSSLSKLTQVLIRNRLMLKWLVLEMVSS